MTDESKAIALIDASIPIPKFKIGDRIYTAYIDSSAETYQCPDCLGTGEWAVKSPAGYENTAQCPRCSGCKKLGLQSYKGFTRLLTVGSVRIDTAKVARASEYDDPVEYMCIETGVGSGNIYREATCFATEAEAQAEADSRAAAHNLKLDNGDDKKRRAQIRYLSTYQWRDAALKESESDNFDLRYRLKQLIGAIVDLKTGTYMMSCDDFASDDRGHLSGAELSLDAAHIALLQEHLVAYQPENIKALIAAREEKEKECHCP